MNTALRQLAAAAIRAPSADNSQPWQLDWDGRELAIRYRPAERVRSGSAEHAVLLSAGHVVEAACECLQAAGGRFAVRWSPQPEAGDPYAVIPIDTFGDGVPRTLPGLGRHTNRFPYANRPLPDAPLREIAADREATARTVLVDDATTRRALADVVKDCAEARFRTRELHEALAASLRMSPAEAAAGDGLDVRTLHLPPGGRAFMRLTADWRRMRVLNRLGAYKVLAGGDTALLYRAPVVLAVVGGTAPVDVLAAGRLLQRTWTRLNALGLAVHPYYAATDQHVRLLADRVPAELRPGIVRTLDRLPPLLSLAAGEMLHLLLRVGWPTRDPWRSPRLPLDTLLVDRTSART